MRSRSLLHSAVIGVGAVLVVLFLAGPFVWVVISSISPLKELTAVPLHWFPRQPTWENFRTLWAGDASQYPAVAEFGRSLVNSVWVAVLTTAFCLVVGSLAAYAFTRLRFVGRHVLFLTIVFSQMLPAVAIVIPLYILVGKVNLLDNLWGLVLVYSSFTLPFVVWVMRGYFQTIPRELEEAAFIDGCTRVGALVRVVVPVSLPGLVATAVFSFLGAWSEFLFALVFTSTPAAKTVPVVVSEFAGRFAINFNLMTAAAVVASVPPILFALFLQRYLISGLTGGAVKG